MKNMKWLALSLIILMSLMTGCSEKAPATNEQTISQIIAFGDSYTDNGASEQISSEILNSVDHPAGAYL